MREAASFVCPHRPPCPGCPRLGSPLADSPAFETLARFATEVGVPLELGPEANARGYRVRARLAVRGRSAAPKLGIFALGSHRVIDIPHCLVHHPLINDVAKALRHAQRELGIEPYSEATERGLVRYLQVVIERASVRAQVVLVANRESPEPLSALCARLAERLGARLHSLFVSPNTSRGNAILGARCVNIAGPDAVRERIAGADVFFPPDAFGQSHLALYERIVERIASSVPDGADVLELYAGTGAIGLSLLPRAARVRFNELAEGSLRGLALGLAALPAPLSARAEVLPGRAASHAALVSRAEVVIADPPRKGLDPELLAALCAAPPERFVYLSCGLDAFRSDARALLESRRLALVELVAYDLFPFTEHIEVLARFERTPS